MLKKGMVIGIIVLLITITISPATGIVVKKNTMLEEPQIIIEENPSNKGDGVDWWPIDYTHPFQIGNLQSEQIEYTTLMKRTSNLEDGSTEVVSAESDGDSQASSIAIDNEGTIHVVWCDTAEYENASDGGLYDIFYKKKLSDGEWVSAEVVTPESSIYNNICSSMDVDSHGNVHVAWWVGKNPDNYHPICYKMKPKNGEWTNIEVIPTDTVANCEVYLTVDFENIVHVVWMGMVSESSNEVDIYYNKKPNGGSWSVTEIVSTESNRGCWWPAIAVGPERTVHVVWSDNTKYQGSGSDYDTFYKMKPNGGNWAATEVVSIESPRECGIPHIAIGPDGDVHISWAEMYMIGLSVFYRMKTSDGSWSTKEEITEICVAYTSRLAVDESGTVHFMFDDFWSCTYNPMDFGTILYRKKPIDGSWSHVEVVSTDSKNGSGGASVPRFIVEEDSLHVVWTDSMNYSGCGKDLDIFYKKKPIIDNQPPNKPIINGPTVVKYDTEEEYTISSTDPDGDEVYYCMIQLYNFQTMPNWIYGWPGPFSAGEEHNVNIQFYRRGIINIMGKAMDVHGALSDWETLSVRVPRNRAINTPFLNFLQNFLENHPTLFPILQKILCYIL